MGYCERRYKGTCIAKITMVSLLFGVRGRCLVELRVKIYYKSYMPFVCERFEKFLINSIHFIFTCDGSEDTRGHA